MAKKRRNTPEEDLQRTVADYLNIIAPMRGFWWSHIAHGGGRTKAEAGIFKAMGLKPGIGDILIIDSAAPPNPETTLVYWIELKAKGRGQSDAQIAFQETMEGHSCEYAVCWSLEHVILVLENWGLV